jgi:hypothetical protein
MGLAWFAEAVDALFADNARFVAFATALLGFALTFRLDRLM